MSKLRFKDVQIQLLLLLTSVVISSSNDAIKKKISLWTDEQQIDDLTEDELQNKIMKIFEEDIVKNTPDEVCIRIANLSLIDSCFEKPIRPIIQDTKELLLACSSFGNYSSLEIFLHNHYNFNELSLHILAKYLNLLLEVIRVEDYFNFIRVFKISFPDSGILPPLSKHFLFKFLSHLQDSNSTLTLVNEDYILKVWNPFSDDVSGFVLYEDQQYTELNKNQSVDDFIRETNIILAVQITSDYLNYLNEHLSAEEKLNFRVIMILFVDMLLSYRFVDDLSQYLGIYMPGICIDNNLPIIKIGRNQLSRTIKLNEFDTLGCAARFCPVYKMLFLDVSAVFNKYACNDHIDSSDPIIWPVVRDSSMYYSENLCYYGIFAIPRRACYDLQEVSFVGSGQTKCLEVLPSSTEELYQNLKCCNYNSVYCLLTEKAQFVPAQSYIDVKLQILYYLKARDVSSREVSLGKALDVIDVGLDILKFDELPYHLFDLILGLFWDMQPISSTFVNEKKRKNFIYRYMPADTQETGFSLRKTRDNSEEGYDYNLEYLPFNNTKDYSHDDNIEAIVLPRQPKDFAMAVIFVIPNSEFASNLSFVCNSRIMIVGTWGYVSHQYFRIYLKTVDIHDNLKISSNEGYWFDLETRFNRLSLVCVSELKDKEDNSSQTITARQYNLDSYLSISNIVVADLDSLSQSVMSVNPRPSEIYT